jgi:hypothetical protein
MKNLILISILGLVIILVSCNNDIGIKPKGNNSSDSTINFNIKAIPDNEYYRANSNGIYKADIELYVRKFQEIALKTPISLQFKTDNFGVFILKKDTLYPDDFTKLSLSDFNNYRLNGQFYTNNIGKQLLNFELQIGKTKKAAKATFETK